MSTRQRRAGPIPILTTKLFAPPRRRHLVARPRLIERLARTLEAGHRLTLVSAPAGSGKTTVLTDWLSEVTQGPGGPGVGWLSLDDADNDAARFLTHLWAAFANAGLDVEPPGLPSSIDADAATTWIPLVNDLTRAARREPARHRVVVLDDYQAVAAVEVNSLVAFLLDHLPDELHLVLATRADPPLPLAKLRAGGQLTELRAIDLRFTRQEVADYLDQLVGLEISAADVGRLQDRTEGWIAGLQLAGLSLRDVADRREASRFIAAFAGSNRFVLDYLADEVLARQSTQTRDFLLRTSVLDRLCGPLCDAVTRGSEGAETLVELDRQNLFLVPLDAERCWYRYHHLFADVLRARLLAEHPEERPSLHSRASAWSSGQGLVEEAVRHALAAEDYDRAAYLMEEALPDLRRHRSDRLMLSWTRSLPDPFVRRSPVLSIWRCWSMLMAGELDAAGAALDDAEAALAAGAADPAVAARWAPTEDFRLAAATVPVYRASLAQARGDVAGTVRQARRAWELAGPADHFIRGAAGGFLGLAAWAAGDVEEALTTFSAAVRSLHAAGNLVDELDSTVVLADLWVAMGRPGRARRLSEQALSRAAAGDPPYPRATADLHVGLAELDRELDDLDHAEAHLESARVLAERTSITENQHRWYVAMAQVRAARGDIDPALDLLDQAESRYRPGFYPNVRPISATRARLLIAEGDLDSARRWADDRGVSAGGGSDYLQEYEQLTLIRLQLAEHRVAHSNPPPADALALCDGLLASAVATRRHGSVREISMLQALVHQAYGDRPQALTALGRSLSEPPEPHSYVRLYLDEGSALLDLLSAAAAGPESVGDLAAGRAQQLLARVEAAADAGAAQPHDPLSRREREVLRMLDSELSGPEIARRLYVTLNTLRTHTKRIYSKLDVSTRAAAVRRARERGLL